jgi:hypothetical protein
MEDEDPAPVPPRDLQSPPAADVPPSPVPANDVPEAAAKRDQLRVPRNEIPTKETRHSSRRVKSKFATYRLSDYVKTD